MKELNDKSDNLSQEENLSVKNTTYFWQLPGNKILITLLFGLLTGHVWHIRGSRPWGGMTGMWAVASLMVCFIYVIFGDRAKCTSTWAGVTVFLMAVTVGGWGPFVSQMSGRFYLQDHYDFAINPWTGVFYLFVTGFGWAPLFGLALGYIFTDKKYTPKQFLGAILVFLAGMVFAQLIISHLIIPITSPAPYELFEQTLISEGEGSPWRFYVENYWNRAVLKNYHGGRNYETMATNLSTSFGAIFLWLYIKYVHKDKKTAHYLIAIPIIIGISMTVANLWMFWSRGCLYSFELEQYTCTPPDWLSGYGWGMWVYFTGFGYGIGVALLLLRQNSQEYTRTRDLPETIIPLRMKNIVKYFTMTAKESPILQGGDEFRT